MENETPSSDVRILKRTPYFRKFANDKFSESQLIHARGSSRALVVEDVPEICRLNKDLLLDMNFEVDTAEDGIDAWKHLEGNAYNLMITDNRMPRMSGVELLDKLHGARKFVPTIMASGTVPDEEITCRPWFQFVTILIKPYTLTELRMAVTQSVRKSSA